MRANGSFWVVFAALLSAALSLGACSREEPGPRAAAADQASIEQRTTTAMESVQGSAQDGKFVTRIRNRNHLSSVLAPTYQERCIARAGNARECGFLRSLMVVEVTMALEEIQAARDQRGASQALAALQLDDEPEVLVAAMRVLGRFPDTPGVADQAWPLLLESPYLQVQQMAASLLGANPDPSLAAMGAYWGINHGSLAAEDPYQEYPDFAPHYPDMGFPEYPAADWFSPADSDRSVGWWTKDDLGTVAARLGEALDAEGLSYQQWVERFTTQSMAAFQAIDPGKQAELQYLIEEWTKTQDLALLERLQKLQEELYAPVEAAGAVVDQGVEQLSPPNIAESMEQARFFVAEERAGHVARVVIAYPLSSLGHTVIQHAWNLTDYPAAWPAAETGPPEQ